MSNTIDRNKIDESMVIAWNLSGESMTLGEYMAPLRAQVATLQAAATAAAAQLGCAPADDFILAMGQASGADYLPAAQVEALTEVELSEALAAIGTEMQAMIPEEKRRKFLALPEGVSS